MKKFTLSVAILLLSASAFSQNCIKALYTSGFTSTNGTVWTLTVDWQSDGQKHMNVKVYVSGVLTLDSCFSVQGNGQASGTKTYININAPLGISTLAATFERRTGNCGGGTSCGTDQLICEGCGILAVKLNSFYAKRNGSVVVLNWKSESEVDAKEYIIERNSGNGFQPVGTVAAINSGSGSNYTYTDNNDSKVVSQYRLKIVDKDASFKLSEIRIVKGNGAVSDFTVFPNPSMGNAKVTITDISEATSVEVIDNMGRIVKTAELRNSNTIDINNLQKGIYLIRVTNKTTGDAVTKKLTVSN